MPAPLYDILVVAHVASAVLGFGSIAIGGRMASIARRSRAPGEEARVVRFFRQGTDWPARLVLAVPVIGFVLLFGGDRAAVGRPWPWIGLGLWTVALGHVTAVGWPAERQAQRELASVVAGDGSRLLAFAGQCARMERAAAVAGICALAAVAVMIVQP